MGVLQIADNNGDKRYIVLQYAMLTEANVTMAEFAVMSTETRDLHQIYQCLDNSLTQMAKSILNLKTDNYMIEVTNMGTKISVSS